jgi:hypothetical protein
MSQHIQLRNQLVGERKEIQSKYTYFLMAAAGASLGFGVQKLDGQVPGHVLDVGLTAMALWILSFAFGCMVIVGAQTLISINIDVVNSQASGDGGRAAIHFEQSKTQLRRITTRQLCQFAALALGVVLFAAWRVLLIFHPSYVPPCVP